MQEIFISEEEIALLMKRWEECGSKEDQEIHAEDHGLEPHLRDEGKQQMVEVVGNILKQNFSSHDDICEAVSKCFECRKGSEFVDAEPHLTVDFGNFLKILRDEFVKKISVSGGKDQITDHDLENFCSAISKYLRCVPIGINKRKYIQYQPLMDACDKIRLKDGYLLDFVDVPADWEQTLAYTRKADDKPIPYTTKHPVSDSIVKMDPAEGYYKVYPLNERSSVESMRTLGKENIKRMFNGYKVASPRDEGNPFKGLEFEKSGSGFFQFALFHNTVQGLNQAEYDPLEQTSYVFLRQKLDKILENIVKNDLGSEISAEDLALLRSIDLRPRVTIEGDSGEVHNVVFSDYGGFYYQRSHMTWPNLMNKVEIRKIFHYHCGMTSGPY